MGSTLVIKKMFAAPIEKVWQAWTDPHRIVAWYGPEGMTTEIHAMDVRVGGKYSLTMTSPKSSHPLKGTFLELDAPHKLVMTWQWQTGGKGDVMGAETTVTVELKEVDGKTEMTLTHILPNEESKESHNQGWSSSFNKLSAELSSVIGSIIQ